MHFARRNVYGRCTIRLRGSPLTRDFDKSPVRECCCKPPSMDTKDRNNIKIVAPCVSCARARAASEGKCSAWRLCERGACSRGVLAYTWGLARSPWASSATWGCRSRGPVAAHRHVGGHTQGSRLSCMRLLGCGVHEGRLAAHRCCCRHHQHGH